MIVNFYKIVSDLGDEVYIGSTIQKLTERKREHNYEFKNKRFNCSSRIVFEKYGFENCRFELIESRECVDDDERFKYEGELILSYPNAVNRCVPKRDKKQYWKEYQQNNQERIKKYYETNKDYILERNRKYYEANKERIKEQRKQKLTIH